jgi:4-hydroxymandelate oxidase
MPNGMTLQRRAALRAFAAFVAGSPLARAQQDPFRPHPRVPRLDELATPIDFEAVAFAKVPRAAYNYTAYGSETEFTLRRNRQAFDWVKLVPRAFADASAKPDTAIDLFGTRMPYPILISPSAGHQALHAEGELATHQGATAANTTMIVSNVSSYPIDKIAAAAAGPLWWQLYPKRTIDENKAPLDEALAAGCKAIVVTVDQQSSYYERALHDRNLAAVTRRTTRATPTNPYRVEDYRWWYTWDLFDHLRKFTKLPIVIKGVLTPEDAKIAIDKGLNAIYVSNHGGRSLDYGPSSLEVLPEIAGAVGGRVPVLIDSGFRRGTDILKALALGANAVCLGRVVRWGLAAYGNVGVQRVLELLQAELVHAMRTNGAASLAEINGGLVEANLP